MKISTAAFSLLVLGVVCIEFGFGFFEEYYPLSHSVSNPNVILWYPVGLVLMLGGVTCVVAGLTEVRMTDFRLKVDELDEKAGQLTGKVAELAGKVGKLTDTVDRLGRESDKLTKNTDKLTTKVEELTRTTRSGFEKLSAILRKKNEASKNR
jgi:FtsZ-binding cell division protein ZapB